MDYQNKYFEFKKNNSPKSEPFDHYFAVVKVENCYYAVKRAEQHEITAINDSSANNFIDEYFNKIKDIDCFYNHIKEICVISFMTYTAPDSAKTQTEKAIYTIIDHLHEILN